MRIFLMIFIFWLSAAPMLAETQLMMVEEDGCAWCERWHEEIGPIYPKTAEARVAPLIMRDIHNGDFSKIELDQSLHYTPTFVLLIDNVEQGRIEGYPGEDFFWGLLQILIEDAGLEMGS